MELHYQINLIQVKAPVRWPYKRDRRDDATEMRPEFDGEAEASRARRLRMSSTE
jgi:hypothetical protein